MRFAREVGSTREGDCWFREREREIEDRWLFVSCAAASHYLVGPQRQVGRAGALIEEAGGSEQPRARWRERGREGRLAFLFAFS